MTSSWFLLHFLCLVCPNGVAVPSCQKSQQIDVLAPLHLRLGSDNHRRAQRTL